MQLGKGGNAALKRGLQLEGLLGDGMRQSSGWVRGRDGPAGKAGSGQA